MGDSKASVIHIEVVVTEQGPEIPLDHTVAVGEEGKADLRVAVVGSLAEGGEVGEGEMREFVVAAFQ